MKIRLNDGLLLNETVDGDTAGGGAAVASPPAAPAAPPADDAAPAPSTSGESLFAYASASDPPAADPAPPAEPAAASAPPADDVAPPPPPPGTWVDADGKFVEGWRDLLPEELRNDPTLALFDSPEAWAKSTIQTKALVGKKFSVPPPDAPPEDIQRFKQAVQAPLSPDGYGELKPEIVPDEMWSKDLEDGFRDVAYRNHMSQAAVKEVLEFYASTIAQDVEITQEQIDAASAEQMRALHNDFGADFARKMTIAEAAFEESGLGRDHWAAQHADLVKAFATLAEAYGREAPYVKGDNAAGSTLLDRINEFSNRNSTNPVVRAYYRLDGQTPEQQKSAQAERLRLIAAQTALKK